MPHIESRGATYKYVGAGWGQGAGSRVRKGPSRHVGGKPAGQGILERREGQAEKEGLFVKLKSSYPSTARSTERYIELGFLSSEVTGYLR